MWSRGAFEARAPRPLRTPPEDLDGDRLARLLAEAWGFPDAEFRYAPVGFGSHHWVATDRDGARRFVTVDDLGRRWPGDAGAGLERLRRALTTAQALREAAGLSFVVAPLPTADGTVLRPVGPRYAAAVYPFVDGRPYPDGEHATPRDHTAVVELLARVHEATPTAQSLAGGEDLQLPGRADLERALGRLREPWTGGPFAEPTRELLSSSAADVRALLREYDRLADASRTRTVAWVITHGEPKADNLLVTDAGPVLIDWDTALVAPAARDLWMVDGGSVEVSSAYTELTGRRVSPDELTLYRLGWDLADIASYVQWFSAAHARTADTDVAWHALSGTLRLREGWPELL